MSTVKAVNIQHPSSANVNAALLSNGSLSIANAISAIGTVSATGAISSSTGITADVDLTNASTDRVLYVGQRATYNTGTTQSTSLYLRVSCSSSQLYRMYVVHRKPQNANNFDINLYPNNTSYSGQFQACGAMNSNSPGFGTTNNSSLNYFYCDDINGSCDAPFLRQFFIFTGDVNTSPCLLQFGGGGYNTSSSSGVCMYGCTWNVINASWTSLGYLSVGPSACWTVTLERLQ